MNCHHFVVSLPAGCYCLVRREFHTWGGRTVLIPGSSRTNVDECLSIAELLKVIACVECP